MVIVLLEKLRRGPGFVRAKGTTSGDRRIGVVGTGKRGVVGRGGDDADGAVVVVAGWDEERLGVDDVLLLLQFFDKLLFHRVGWSHRAVSLLGEHHFVVDAVNRRYSNRLVIVEVHVVGH